MRLLSAGTPRSNATKERRHACRTKDACGHARVRGQEGCIRYGERQTRMNAVRAWATPRGIGSVGNWHHVRVQRLRRWRLVAQAPLLAGTQAGARSGAAAFGGRHETPVLRAAACAVCGMSMKAIFTANVQKKTEEEKPHLEKNSFRRRLAQAYWNRRLARLPTRASAETEASAGMRNASSRSCVPSGTVLHCSAARQCHAAAPHLVVSPFL